MLEKLTTLAAPEQSSVVKKDDPAKVKEAARQFESLLIGQMLRSAREASAGDDEDSTKSIMLDVADQQFSKLLANNGGMGLSRMIVQGLKQGEANAHR